MGCSSTREGKANSELSIECDSLMQFNLDLLTILEYLYIQDNRTGVALSIMLMKKRTDEYYKVVQTYRQYWLSEAKSCTEADIQEQVIKRCEHEQKKEKEQLMNCRERLYKSIENIRPSWSKDFSSATDYLIYLENLPSIVHVSTTLYENFYTATKPQIKLGMEELNSPLTDLERLFIKSLKQVTIFFYKFPNNRVYYTSKIPLKERKSEKNNGSISDVRPKSPKFKEDRYRESTKSRDTRSKESLSREFPKGSISKEIRHETKKSENSRYKSESYESSEEFYDSDDDEEIVARISISQK
ncbi:hypothetical protein SteCoe_28719 [Stentor coeruleus]|uniref:Uncharacterized protein n=1 Tax=Stentor coeruleus TaxID=5963 RepID=A0A1R2B822_9CILI|nr:hypothetical protein SteCoe_28719 [Stentor coeruleus]